jgi:hypothetical protein
MVSWHDELLSPVLLCKDNAIHVRRFNMLYLTGVNITRSSKIFLILRYTIPLAHIIVLSSSDTQKFVPNLVEITRSCARRSAMALAQSEVPATPPSQSTPLLIDHKPCRTVERRRASEQCINRRQRRFCNRTCVCIMRFSRAAGVEK